MAFLCEDCMDKAGFWAPTVSFGPCEDCGQQRNCSDVKTSKINDIQNTPPVHVRHDMAPDLRIMIEELEELKRQIAAAEAQDN